LLRSGGLATDHHAHTCTLPKRIQRCGAANFSALRQTALSLLKNDTTQKIGIKNKRINAALSEDYLHKILFYK
jgi:hypothetical protein